MIPTADGTQHNEDVERAHKGQGEAARKVHQKLIKYGGGKLKGEGEATTQVETDTSKINQANLKKKMKFQNKADKKYEKMMGIE